MLVYFPFPYYVQIKCVNNYNPPTRLQAAVQVYSEHARKVTAKIMQMKSERGGISERERKKCDRGGSFALRISSRLTVKLAAS